MVHGSFMSTIFGLSLLAAASSFMLEVAAESRCRALQVRFGGLSVVEKDGKSALLELAFFTQQEKWRPYEVHDLTSTDEIRHCNRP